MSAPGAPQRRWGWLPLFVPALIYTIVICVIVAIRAESSSDFRDYWRTADWFRTTGEITSSAGVHNYLPFFPIFMAPWSLLDLRVAIVIFTLLSIVLLVLTVLMTQRMMSGEIGTAPAPGTLLLLGLMLPYVTDSLVVGTVMPLVMFLVVASLFVVERVPRAQRSHRVATQRAARSADWLAGAALGLAALIKVIPAIMGFFFLVRGRWRVVASAVATAIVLGLGLPIAALGLDQTIREHQEYQRRAVQGQSAHATIFAKAPDKSLYSNNALPMVLRRLLTRTDANPRPELPPLFVNVTDWPAERIWLLYLQLVTILSLITLALTFTARPTVGGHGHVWAAFGLWGCLALLLSPLMWTHYLVLCWPALAAISFRAERSWHAGRMCRISVVAIGGWLILAGCLAWPAARAAGAQLASVLLLWCALALILWKGRRHAVHAE